MFDISNDAPEYKPSRELVEALRQVIDKLPDLEKTNPNPDFNGSGAKSFEPILRALQELGYSVGIREDISRWLLLMPLNLTLDKGPSSS